LVGLVVIARLTIRTILLMTVATIRLVATTHALHAAVGIIRSITQCLVTLGHVAGCPQSGFFCISHRLARAVHRDFVAFDGRLCF